MFPSITMPDGTKLGELDRGKNSGWMFKVNGKIPDVSMGAYGLKTVTASLCSIPMTIPKRTE